jgi:hypothetical protein
MTEADFERLYADVLGRHAEPAALQAELEDPAFVAWLLQRLLADKPDLRLLARHILEQLGPEAKEEPHESG